MRHPAPAGAMATRCREQRAGEGAPGRCHPWTHHL